MKKKSVKSPVRVAVISLGCAKNLVDTEVMCGDLATSDFVLTDAMEEADVLLINTCSFVADARSEAEQEIRLGLQWKRQGAGRFLLVAGCLPQRNLGQVRSQFPEVDLFLGLDDVNRIAALLTQLVSEGQRDEPQERFESSQFIYDHTAPRLQLTPSNFAYLKIGEGCDHACRFCAIPGIRGRQRSRAIESIVQEAQMLLEQGVRELNLIAQDTTRYGRDRDDGATVEKLLTQCDGLSGNFWLRLLYTHPRHFHENLIQVYREATHLVPYVDIPLQHISNHMLHAMGRGMDGTATRDLMDSLRQGIPNVTVRSTVLVGYPGETEDDFAELYEYLEKYRFDRLGVFIFSPEEGTPTAELRDEFVPANVAEERRQQLLGLQQRIAREANSSRIGATIEVLVEGPGEERNWIGRSRGDAPDVDNLVHFNGPDHCLQDGFCRVLVEDAEPYDLYGTYADV